MTIAIKMDMPKGCGVCNGICREVFPYYCHICDIKFTEEETHFIIDFPQLINKKCKLTDLGSEDMSWEELVERCKNIGANPKKFLNNTIIIHSDKMSCDYHFVENGDICNQFDGTIFNNMTPFQMWQIIQALVGER